MCVSLVFVILVFVILAPLLKVRKSPRAGMTEGQGLYLLELVSRILIQTCCLYTSYIFVRVSISETMSKNGGVGYNVPLLQNEDRNSTCEISTSLQFKENHLLVADNGGTWMLMVQRFLRFTVAFR